MNREGAFPEVVVLDNVSDVATEAARRFLALCRDAIADHGAFFVALSGGSTPNALYDVLSIDSWSDQVDWDRVHVFFSDERFVSPESPESNYHTAFHGLLSRVSIPAHQVYPVPTVAVDPQTSAGRYAETIAHVLGSSDVGTPQFDLIFLGMGPDGHTASLFPDTEGLNDLDSTVLCNWVPKLDAWRISFSFTLLNAAKSLIFLACGADKAPSLANVLSGAGDLPASRVYPVHGTLTWLVDKAAAAEFLPK
ncbi:MAG: 6-phosphogluconolactonase [Chloroflexota bacterium]